MRQSGLAAHDLAIRPCRPSALVAQAGGRAPKCAVAHYNFRFFAALPFCISTPPVRSIRFLCPKIWEELMIQFTINGRTITDEHEAPQLSLADVLRFSSNIGIVQ